MAGKGARDSLLWCPRKAGRRRIRRQVNRKNVSRPGASKPPARGLQAASESGPAKTKRLACGLALVEAAATPRSGLFAIGGTVRPGPARTMAVEAAGLSDSGPDRIGRPARRSAGQPYPSRCRAPCARLRLYWRATPFRRIDGRRVESPRSGIRRALLKVVQMPTLLP
jgi:hypothetical protein